MQRTVASIVVMLLAGMISPGCSPFYLGDHLVQSEDGHVVVVVFFGSSETLIVEGDGNKTVFPGHAPIAVSKTGCTVAASQKERLGSRAIVVARRQDGVWKPEGLQIPREGWGPDDEVKEVRVTDTGCHVQIVNKTTSVTGPRVMTYSFQTNTWARAGEEVWASVPPSTELPRSKMWGDQTGEFHEYTTRCGNVLLEKILYHDPSEIWLTTQDGQTLVLRESPSSTIGKKAANWRVDTPVGTMMPFRW